MGHRLLKNFLETGKIVGTHGVRGNVKVKPWCNSKEDLCTMKNLYLGDTKEKIELISAFPHKNIVVMSIKGIDDIDKALAICGKIIYLDRNDISLEEDEYFVQDIIGSAVFDSNTHEYYGQVSDVLKPGANDVYEVKKEGQVFLIPAIHDVVDSIDIKEQKIFITPLNGLFD